MSGCGCDGEFEAKDKAERKVLLALLLINATMFVVELTAGLFADSTGLLADSLDMLADAMSMGLRSTRWAVQWQQNVTQRWQVAVFRFFWR